MQYCPRCNRAGDDIGNCGNGAAFPCPPAMEVDSQADIVIKCRPCKKTYAIPVERLMKARSPLVECSGDCDVCKAVVIRPKGPSKKDAAE